MTGYHRKKKSRFLILNYSIKNLKIVSLNVTKLLNYNSGFKTVILSKNQLLYVAITVYDFLNYKTL